MNAPRAVLASLTLLALLPASASAATATVTGDDGNPVAINTTAPTPIRNMSVRYSATMGASDAAYHKTVVLGPDGAAASSGTSCYPKSAIPTIDRIADFRGNGTYTVVVSTYTNNACTAGGKEQRFLYAINAGTAVTAPAAPYLLTRQKGSFTSITHRFGVALNPGASIYEFRYARNGVIGPDGAIAGPAEDPFVSHSQGFSDTTFREPGKYVGVIRAMSNNYFTPWSAPITFTVKAPFDLSYVTFPDSRGPSYKLRAQMRDTFARGKRVTVYIAKGRKGGKYRKLGRSSKVNSRGRFTRRFRLSSPGRYRVQYRFKGSSLVVKGKVTEGIRISRFGF